jgi:CMP-N-acetylneuraminic acid synthetase
MLEIAKDDSDETRRVVAVVPMKGHSERVPGKNFRDFHGKPLHWHILTTLLSCKKIHQVVVDTDSEDMKRSIATSFPDVTIVDRPESLWGDHVPMNEILVNVAAQIPSAVYLQTHCTNPLLQVSTLDKAIDLYFENVPIFDSVFSVKQIQSRLYDQVGRAINHNPSNLLRTQDLPPVYEENSCVYVFGREALMQRRNRIGQRPRMMVMEDWESVDIDTESDFLFAELLMKRREASAEAEAEAALGPTFHS